MTVEFTVRNIRVQPSGSHDMHLMVNDELSTLIQQLCEDGYADDILSIVKEWKLANKPENGG